LSDNSNVCIYSILFFKLADFLIRRDGITVPKGYIYFAVFFSLVVEMMNMRLRKRAKPAHLHQRGEEVLNEE